MCGLIHVQMVLYLSAVLLPYTHAATCENVVRLADLQDIIKNQTKLIQEQRKMIESLTASKYLK